jgi:LysR family transcriptional regulator, regulator of abg operon
MDLRQLKYFVAVADAGSFSAAAKAVRIAQPSLTVSIRTLERELGEVLLVRGPRGVTLTPVGQTFVTYARSILREAEKAVDEVRQVQGLKHGKVAVGLMSVFSTFVAPVALAQFYRKNPAINVSVDVSAHATEEIVENIETGAWDFAFALYRQVSDLKPSLKAEGVATFESAVYAAPSHPLAKSRSVTMAQMSACDWVVSSLSAGATFLQRTFEADGLKRPEIKIVSNSFGLIREVAQSAPFLCMLPVRFAEREVASGNLVRVKQNKLTVNSQAGLVSSARKELTPAARQLMSEFRAAALAESNV